MNYSEILKDPCWQKKRLEIFLKLNSPVELSEIKKLIKMNHE